MPRISPHQPLEIDPDALAAELAETWSDRLNAADWPNRLRLIGDIHDQLRSDVGDLDTYCAVSPKLVAGLIERIQGGPVQCDAQAHIYSNSADERHRQDAGRWLKQNQAPEG